MPPPFPTALVESEIAPPTRWRFTTGTPAAATRDGVPQFRPDMVPRPRLLRRLAGDPMARLALLVAPAGYGKTTLLSEWAQRDERPFAWISLVPGDDDPERLDTRIDAALSSLPASVPHVLVLDQAHVLTAPEALGVLLARLDTLAPGSMLAVASRREPGLPVGRLRAQRLVTELTAADLAMNRVEAAMLLSRSGLDADGPQALRLTEETEGWPVGLYLGALATARSDHEGPIRFAGDDRLMADYLRDELLCGLSDEQLAFVRRTSVLDRLSGPLCDAVLESRHSGTVLRDLVRDNVLIQPLDSCDREFRYHALFADMLRGELRRREHEAEAGLHQRASTWHEQHDDHDRAVAHAIASGDHDRAGELMWSRAPAYAFGGRSAVLGAWLATLNEPAIAATPTLALTAATFHFARGDADRVEHWLRAARRTARTPDVTAAIAILHAGLEPCAAGPPGEPVTPSQDSALLALERLSAGVARHLTGDREGATALLQEGARLGVVAAPVLRALCLAQLGIVAAEAEDWEEAALHAAQAHAQLQTVKAGDDPIVALVHAVCAVVDAHRGHPETARREARDANRLLAASSAPAPWLGAETRIWLARTAIRLSDVVNARALLAQAARLRREVQGADVLEHWIDDAWGRADAFAAGATGAAPSPTMAELRVLRFLPSHLSFREIGDRLHVSANTVKTQALAVYRKLDVSSRSEAVQRGCDVGLLDG